MWWTCTTSGSLIINPTESEKTILGLALGSPTLYGDRLQDLDGLLQLRPHQLILGALEALYSKHKTYDLILLHDSFSEPDLKEVGGASYLGSLMSGLPESASFDALIDTLREAAKRRQYAGIADRLMSALASGENNDYLERIVQASVIKDEQIKTPTIKIAAGEAAKNLDEIRNMGVDLSFGIKQLDDSLGGIRRKKLYTIGGRTSQGKTTVCANLIRENLVQNKRAKIYYNGFENVDEMPVRLAALNSKVRLDHFLKPHLISEEDYQSAQLALADLTEYDDRLLIAFGDSVKTMRQVCKSYRPDIVFVDYIQRLAHKYDLGGSDRLSHAIGKAVSDLQDLAIDFNCAMFCCSQFKRASSEFRGKEPSIEDLKESGDIENESDNIILLWWPWRETLDDKRYIPNQYRFLVRKNKLGPCLDVYSKIDLETLSISDF